jgi:FdhE protein
MIDSPSQDLKEALLQLNKLKKERPALTGPADFFADVLPGLFAEESRDPVPSMTPEHARAKLADGIPLLRNEKVRVDTAQFQRRWLHIAAAVARHQDKESGQKLADVFRNNQWNAEETLATVLSDSPQDLHSRAESLGLPPDLTATVVRLTLFPVLARWNADLAFSRAGALWERGYCPTCGSWPLLGEFRGLEQIRWLRCGFCAAEWKVPRLFCPYCENRDHRSLGYLSVEGDGSKYRIDTCDSCHSYVKMLTTLTPLSCLQLLAADVATIHLDLAAAGKAYGASGKEKQEDD